ncbi:MAG: Flp pilus assembly protein CpaB [Rhodospirillaceae bacterium]|jgi:pilus assembly protein CpaB|nr:Flp pilus assembly protein CpaB [Rhodospirillaceae bacterium]MBT4116744.1 Flp pilus assembly protein CpaB [Rhodospirillaceae bacterium]MBT4670892.1 Flp pilus assembly protein CpaB [Rhodospirillaceae bacterium]MBT4721353.1 Flp pilus assembly protein CpaB [Rhodospirillaceae bacterium]MBT4748819.1 Flp pilus assembly protein CpaB [Rhodospirillaceae bacterium]
MTIRVIILVIFALGAAASTALFARNWVAAQKAQPAAAEEIKQTPATAVLVAASDLSAGAFLREKHFKWQPWPENGVADGYVVRRGSDDETETARKSLIGAVVRASINAGEPLTPKRVVQPGDRGFLAAVLSPGARAVSVPVNATTGIAGFVFPGDKVDLILTVKFNSDDARGKKRTRYVSKTLLAAIRVIAIDQKTEQTDGKVKVVKNVTLEVNPKEAEKIAIGLHMGAISLSLQSLARADDVGDLAGLETAAGGAAATARVSKRNFTLDNDVFSIGRSGPRRQKPQVQVLRGSTAEKAKF